jgi:hypothetical protein|tara:strand:+ start:163 stop:1173 length:1011 start_codon:yes stop_codon:yes gene_type:complete
MKKAFFINGGAGRVLCSIPALEYYKEHTDPDVVIVSEAWHELFLSSKLRNNIWPVGSKELFKTVLKDREIISPEPYRLNAYFNQRVNLIQAFDMLINDVDEEVESKPINLDLGKADQIYGYNLVSQVKQQMKKDKVVVFQPFGSGVKIDGNFVFDESGRSFELSDVFRIVDDLSKDYAVILMTNLKIPTDRPMGAAIPEGASLLQWTGVVNAADYFLGCDSMGQHFAHALGKPATVVIGSTFPENISYPGNKDFTIIDNGKENRVYVPYRVTSDPASERHNEDNMILNDENYKKIMNSITDKLGKPSSAGSQLPLANNIKPNLFNTKKNKKVIGEK